MLCTHASVHAIGLHGAHMAAWPRMEWLPVQGMPQEQLALPLLVMLAQQRRFIAIQTQSGPLKLIAELYDKAQESLYLVRQLPLVSHMSKDNMLRMWQLLMYLGSWVPWRYSCLSWSLVWPLHHPMPPSMGCCLTVT